MYSIAQFKHALWYKFHEHVLVVRHDCDSHRDTKYNTTKRFLCTINVKPIYHIWGYAFY